MFATTRPRPFEMLFRFFFFFFSYYLGEKSPSLYRELRYIKQKDDSVHFKIQLRFENIEFQLKKEDRVPVETSSYYHFLA